MFKLAIKKIITILRSNNLRFLTYNILTAKDPKHHYHNIDAVYKGANKVGDSENSATNEHGHATTEGYHDNTSHWTWKTGTYMYV